MWYIYIVEFYSVIKKNGIMPFSVVWMQIEISHQAKSVRQKDKCTISLIWGWNLKYGTNEPVYKRDSQT